VIIRERLVLMKVFASLDPHYVIEFASFSHHESCFFGVL
jgi:hypothetical protein